MNKVSSQLRTIAARIDASKSPSAAHVAADIKKVISGMERDSRVAHYAALITAAVKVERVENKEIPAWKTIHGEKFEEALEQVANANKDELYDAVRVVFRTAERFGRDLDPEKG